MSIPSVRIDGFTNERTTLRIFLEEERDIDLTKAEAVRVHELYENFDNV